MKRYVVRYTLEKNGRVFYAGTRPMSFYEEPDKMKLFISKNAASIAASYHPHLLAEILEVDIEVNNAKIVLTKQSR